MAAASVPLNVLVEAREALSAFRQMDIPWNHPMHRELLALQMRASHAEGALGFHVEQITKGQQVEVAS